MAIIRFLDGKGNCCQINTPEQQMLVYLTENERKLLSQAEKGDCLYLMQDDLPQEEMEQVIEKLNTKDPKVIV
jgi:hypothetical protein